MEKCYILMADIVKSRQYEGSALMTDFKTLVKEANTLFQNRLLSPLTITLGDEFQGICQDLVTGLDIMIFFEERLITNKYFFKLRYILYFGTIETEINKTRAYEMVGPGLTAAREHLQMAKKDKFNRFSLFIPDERKNYYINNYFHLLKSLIDDWSAKDYDLLKEFMRNADYYEVARNINKSPSLIWRRKNSLKIVEYNILKQMIITMADE